MALSIVEQEEKVRQLSFVLRLLTLLAVFMGAFLVLANTASLPPAPFFLVSHNILEITSVVVSILIFAIGWNTHVLNPNRTVLLLASGFFGVALLDFAHAMSYQGMPDYFTANSIPKGIQFWLMARYLAALTLLLVVIRGDSPGQAKSTQSMRVIPLLAVLCVVAASHWVFLFMPGLVPATFVEGQGLTRFKVMAELGVIAIHVLTVVLLSRHLWRRDMFNRPLLLGAVCVMALSEVFFMFYSHSTDYFNYWGHVYKVVGYVLLYRAVFVEAIAAPYRSLKNSEQHLQAVFNAIPDLTFEVDRQGRYLGVHALRQQLLAAPIDTLVGKTIAETLPAAAATIAMEALAEADRWGYTQGQQYVLDLAEGPRWFELSVAKKSGGKPGDVSQFVVLSRDITERVRDQETLRKLMHAVEQSPSVILITDLDGRIEFANPALTATTGYSIDEVMGENPRMLRSGKTPPETYDDLWRTLQAGHPWSGEFINRRKDGSEYIESVLISPIRDDSGAIIHYMAIKQDITRLRASELRIEELANFDTLTGLPNRAYFSARFQQALGLVERGHEPLALLFLDLDHFKHVNESLGHQVGDELLQEIAGRLKVMLRDEDTVSRQGGDEFIIVLPFTDASGAADLARRLLEQVSEVFHIHDFPLIVTASIGIALYPEDGRNFEALEQGADAAMYRAKQEGRNSYRFFSSDMQVRAARTLRLENALRFALAGNQLEVHYQPQVRIDDGRVVGVEALLRWHHPELGMISPAEFIPIAENSGQIIAIGEWVIRTAVNQACRWRASGNPDLVVAVNLSLLQFRHAGLVAMIREVLETSGLPPANLELELTESVAMSEPEKVVAQIGILGDLGVRLAIDDFGTGYSSLSYIKRLRVDTLKIDQSFVQALDDNDRSIVHAVISMARALGLNTLAEGVETAQQLTHLREIGCDQVQGYLFSPAMPAQGIDALLREGFSAITSARA